MASTSSLKANGYDIYFFFRNLNMREASQTSTDLNWPPLPQPEQLLPLSSYDYDRMEEEYRKMQEQKDEVHVKVF